MSSNQLDSPNQIIEILKEPFPYLRDNLTLELSNESENKNDHPLKSKSLRLTVPKSQKNVLSINEALPNSNLNFTTNKKLVLSSQIPQPNTHHLVFEEPCDFSEKSVKSMKISSKQSRTKISKKNKGKQNMKTAQTIQSSGGLLKVLKTIKKFFNNLKFQTIYHNYKNLNYSHLEVINDLARAEISNNEKDMISFKTSKSFSQTEKAKSQLCISLNNYMYKGIELIQKIYKFYDKVAFNFHPDDILVYIWNLCLMQYLIFLMIVVPLNTCFATTYTEQIGIYYKIINASAIFFLLIDIFFCVHTGYYDKGAKIMERYKILKRYFGKRFLCDFVAFIPFLLMFLEKNKSNHYIDLLFFLKAFRLRDIIHYFESKLCLNDYNEGIFNLIKVSFKILYIAHIIACVFHNIGSLMILWDERSWLNLINVQYLDDWKIRYIYSIYWAVTTLITVGYGDITPQNPYEVLFTILVILIGCGIFAYGINSVGSILSMMIKKEQEFKKEVKILNNFMQKNNLNSDLQMRLREYLIYIRKEENAEDLEKEQVILNKLSSTLQYEVILNTTGQSLKKIKLFSYNFSELLLQKLVLNMKKKRYVPEELIFEEESTDSSIYFILKGQVELFLNGKKLCTFNQEESFNEIPFLTDEVSRYGVKSVGYTTVLIISRKDFLDLLKEFPSDFERFCELRDKILIGKNIEDLHIECNLCGKKSHIARDCPFVNAQIDNFVALKKYQHSLKYVEMERKYIKRRKANAAFRSAKKLSKDNKKLKYRRNLSFLQSSLYEEDKFSSKYSHSDSQDSDSQLKTKKSLNLDNNFQEIMIRSKEKIPAIIPENQRDQIISEEIDIFGYAFKDKEKEEQKEIDLDNFKGNKEIVDLFWMGFDNHKNFEFYFSKYNFRNVIDKLCGKRGKLPADPNLNLFGGKSKFLLAPINTGSLKKGGRSSFFKADSNALSGLLDKEKKNYFVGKNK